MTAALRDLDRLSDLAQSTGEDNRPTSAAPSPHGGVTRVMGVQPNESAAFDCYPTRLDGVTEETRPSDTGPSSTEACSDSSIPGESDRPCFRVFDIWVEASGKKLRPGVWFFGVKASKKADDPPTLTSQWVCSPLHIEAVTLDGSDASYGRLLAFENTSRRWRQWAMPMEMLRGSGDELRGELLHRGVELDPQGGRIPLMSYLQSVHPKRRMRCASQVGWCDGSFVLPDKVIGPGAADVIFQSEVRNRDEFSSGGTLDAWRDGVASKAVGNPLLMLALSVAFSGPVMALVHAESGGVHIVGDTSTGKTTAADAACSVWGGPGYKRSWRATANGLEGAAVMFNDGLLCLDEISECDPRDIGAIVYSLGNGQGKQRADRGGAARGVARWRCAVLSTGERTVATAMAEGGYRSKAGQAVRILDVPAARKHGVFDALHGATNGAALSDAIKVAASKHFGHAGRAFLQELTLDRDDHSMHLERIKRLPAFVPNEADGLIRRGAGRFALFALAGELATQYGLTGWAEGAAIDTAAKCFAAWRAARGAGNAESRQVAEAVLSFIERHGDARFSDYSASDNSHMVRDRAGWWRIEGGSRLYLFTADGMREATKGFDLRSALDKLTQCGALPTPGSDGKRTTVYRIDGRPARLYPVDADKLGENDGTR